MPPRKDLNMAPRRSCSVQHRLRSAVVALALAAWGIGTWAQSGSSYAYATPAGWSRSADGDTEVFSPPRDGMAQILLIAPKAATGDFDTQFAAERAALEQFWGLRAPAPVAPQRGQGASGPYAAYFASYDSDGGPRYMSFLATAQQQRFAMVVFVAASHDAFNRLAPQATELFTTLRLPAR